MRRLIIALAATVAMTSISYADQYRHRHQRQYHNNNNWVAPLVGGLVVGGLLLSSRQNYYAGPGYGNVPAYGYQPYCRNVHVGTFWNGWRWVNQYETMCD